MQHGFEMTWSKITSAILLAGAVFGCTAPWLQEPLRNKELNAVLETYKKQNAELAVQRETATNQSIRRLTVTDGVGSEPPLVTVEVDRASLPIVIGRILHEANISYVVEPGLLHGTVTSRLTNVPLLRAINALVEPSGLVATLQDNVMAIKEREIESARVGRPGDSHWRHDPAHQRHQQCRPAVASPHSDLEHLFCKIRGRLTPSRGAGLFDALYGVEPRPNFSDSGIRGLRSKRAR